MSYKRNQVAEAISTTIGEGDDPSVALQTKMKRLLETDRALGRSPRSKLPEKANYAFYSEEAPGSGIEVLFSEYEAFALYRALDLMEHGYPQATVVSIFRQARPFLEPKHAEILSWKPEELFDQEKILEMAQEGSLVVGSTRPVLLFIATALGRLRDPNQPKRVAIFADGKFTPPLKIEPGTSTTRMELTVVAHKLHDALQMTRPSKRGRGSS